MKTLSDDYHGLHRWIGVQISQRETTNPSGFESPRVPILILDTKMNIFEQLYLPYKLKEVKRAGFVGDRLESTAEHLFSTIMLSQYFLKRISVKLDEKKVLLMILYHDLVEVYAGDTFILDEKAKKSKQEREEKAFEKIKQELPKEILQDYIDIYHEFKEGKTMEAKFVLAVEALDPVMHHIKQPEAWKKYGFTEKKVRALKEPLFKPFPEIQEFFQELLIYLNKNNIIPKE